MSKPIPSNDAHPDKRTLGTQSSNMSSRKTRLASEKHLKNVTRRGSVPRGKIENKKNGQTVGPYLLFFFLFVILGSGLFQILKAAKGGGPFSS